MSKNKIAGMKVLSALCINLAAGWLGVAFITPVSTVSTNIAVILLTRDILFSIVLLSSAFIIERAQI